MSCVWRNSREGLDMFIFSNKNISYAINGDFNYQGMFGNNKEPIEALRDPELRCMSFMQYSRASSWRPV